MKAFCSFARFFAVGMLMSVGTLRGAVDTSRQPVTNDYHGISVVDPYQWLEKGADPAVRQWSADQNTKARRYLDGSSARPFIEDRLTRLLNQPSTNYFGLNWRRGKLFLMKFQPPAQQAMLVALATVTNLASERIIVDPNQLITNATTSIDWYLPSWD